MATDKEDEPATDSPTLETPVVKKRRVLKRVLKKKGGPNLNGSVTLSSVKKKKVFHALSQNSFNTSIQKQTLKANNRALASRLANTRIELRTAQETIIVLQRENQELHRINTNLEQVAGLRNDQIDVEVANRMARQMDNMQKDLSKMGRYLMLTSTTLTEMMDKCCVSSRQSTMSSARGSSLYNMSDIPTPPNDGYKRSLYQGIPKTDDLNAEGNEECSIVEPQLLVPHHEMSVIAEQSMLIDDITPPPNFFGSSPSSVPKEADEDSVVKPRRVLKNKKDTTSEQKAEKQVTNEKTNTENGDSIQQENNDKDNCSPEKHCSNTVTDRRGTFVAPQKDTAQKHLTRSKTDSSSSENSETITDRRGTFVVPPKDTAQRNLTRSKTDSSSSENSETLTDRRGTFVVPPIDTAQRSLTRSKTDSSSSENSEMISDRRGTFVVPPKDVLPAKRNSAKRNTDSSSSDSSESSEILSPKRPMNKKNSAKITKNVNLDKRKTYVLPSCPVNSAANSRKTFVVENKTLQLENFPSEGGSDDVTRYFNTDMDFTEVIDHSQLISPESFKKKFMEEDGPLPEEKESNVVPVPPSGKDNQQHKRKLPVPVKSFKESDQKASQDKIVDSDKESSLDETKTSNQQKSIVEFRLPKPGKIVFSATRKCSDGTRKPVPKQQPRSRSKVKLSSISSKKSTQKSPEKVNSIFDFHDKTPRSTTEQGSKVTGSVYDLSMNESVQGPAGRTTIGQLRDQTKEEKSKSLGGKDNSRKSEDSVQPTNRKSSLKQTDAAVVGLLGDEPSYYMELKDSSPDAKTSRSKSKTRSKSRGRATDEKVVKRSKSRSRINDQMESKDDDDVISLKSDSEDKKTTKENKSSDDKDVYYLPLKDASLEINTRKSRGRSRSRSKPSTKNYDTEEESSQINENEFENEKGSRKSRSRVRKSGKDEILENDPLLGIIPRDDSPEITVRKSRAKSRSRKEVSSPEVEENSKDADRKSRGRSRTRVTNEPSRRSARSKSRAKLDKEMDEIGISDAEEDKRVGEQKKMSTSYSQNDECSKTSSVVKETLLGDEPTYYLPLKDDSPEVNVRTSRMRSRSRKRISDSDIEETLKSSANVSVEDRRSRGRSRARSKNEPDRRSTRSRSRARLNKQPCDSDEEVEILMKNQDQVRHSYSNDEFSHQADEIRKKVNKEPSYERKSDRVNVENDLDEDDGIAITINNYKENNIKSAKKSKARSRKNSVSSHVMDHEGDEGEAGVKKLPEKKCDEETPSSLKRPLSSKSASVDNKKQRMSQESKVDDQGPVMKKKSLSSQENKENTLASSAESFAQDMRKKLDALFNADVISGNESENGEGRRSRRGANVCYKEPSLNVKMRRPGDSSNQQPGKSATPSLQSSPSRQSLETS